jgi:hypothetical protein
MPPVEMNPSFKPTWFSLSGGFVVGWKRHLRTSESDSLELQMGSDAPSLTQREGTVSEESAMPLQVMPAYAGAASETGPRLNN